VVPCWLISVTHGTAFGRLTPEPHIIIDDQLQPRCHRVGQTARSANSVFDENHTEFIEKTWRLPIERHSDLRTQSKLRSPSSRATDRCRKSIKSFRPVSIQALIASHLQEGCFGPGRSARVKEAADGAGFFHTEVAIRTVPRPGTRLAPTCAPRRVPRDGARIARRDGSRKAKKITREDDRFLDFSRIEGLNAGHGAIFLRKHKTRRD
jgi:hypothetical protein